MCGLREPLRQKFCHMRGILGEVRWVLSGEVGFAGWGARNSPSDVRGDRHGRLSEGQAHGLVLCIALRNPQRRYNYVNQRVTNPQCFKKRKRIDDSCQVSKPSSAMLKTAGTQAGRRVRERICPSRTEAGSSRHEREQERL